MSVKPTVQGGGFSSRNSLSPTTQPQPNPQSWNHFYVRKSHYGWHVLGQVHCLKNCFNARREVWTVSSFYSRKPPNMIQLLALKLRP